MRPHDRALGLLTSVVLTVLAVVYGVYTVVTHQAEPLRPLKVVHCIAGLEDTPAVTSQLDTDWHFANNAVFYGDAGKFFIPPQGYTCEIKAGS